MKKVIIKENKPFKIEELLCKYDKIKRERILTRLLSKKLILVINEGYSFKYVGILIIEDIIFIIYPKYFKKFSQKSMLTIIKVLRKYSAKTELSIEENETLGQQPFYGKSINNIFTIIEDYLNNGLYLLNKNVRERNFGNKVDWASTVKHEKPIIQGKNLIYLNHLYKRKVFDHNSRITQIHRAILIECIAFVQNLGLDELFSEDLTYIKSHLLDSHNLSLENINSLEIIQTYLQIENNDIKKNTLFNLKIYIDKIHYKRKEENEMYFFGTRTFHSVWEKVCESLFTTEFTSLNNKVIQNSKPNWILKSNDIKISTGGLKPDIVGEIKNGFFILDAKYYFLESEHITKINTGDITKQYLYAMAVNKLFIRNKQVIKNGFLFPSLGENKRIGHVEIDFLNNELPIEIYLLNAEYVFSKYLLSETLSEEHIVNFLS